VSNFGAHVVTAPQVFSPVTPGPDDTTVILGDGANILPWSAANTMTGWHQIVASTAEDYAALDWHIAVASNGTAMNVLVEIGVGAPGSEQVLIPAFHAYGTPAYSQSNIGFVSPIPLPKGTRLSVRWQGSAAWPATERPVAYLRCHGIRSGGILPRCSRATTLLIDSTNSRGTLRTGVGYGIGAWQELTASLPFDVRYAVYLEHGTGGGSAERFRDLGIGAGAGIVPVWRGITQAFRMGQASMSVAWPRGQGLHRRDYSSGDVFASVILFG
jgi:hypothetical protein